jgi:hypothetical protein
MFGGVAILRGLVAALGAALFVGNAAALYRSRPTSTKAPTWQQRQQGQHKQNQSANPGPDRELKRIPSIVMAVLGLLIFAWAVASLVSSS